MGSHVDQFAEMLNLDLSHGIDPEQVRRVATLLAFGGAGTPDEVAALTRANIELNAEVTFLRRMQARAMVDEFHHAFRLPVTDLPDRAELNLRVLREEVDELADAMVDGDRVATTHELADVLYVAYEIAATYSLPVDMAFAEVHRANMSKLDDDGNPVFRADGKVLKGPNYRPPDIAALMVGTPA